MNFTDPILQGLVKKYPAPHFENRTPYLFEDLIESVISQQLSVKASDTIYKRFKALFNGCHSEQSEEFSSVISNEVRDLPVLETSPIKGTTSQTRGGRQAQNDKFDIQFPTPQQILDMPDETIRSAGISFQKISYIKSIADAFLSGLIDRQKIKDMTDEEVIASLTQIRGVGKWTAEMVLIFTLNRSDVFSIGDLGIRNAIKKLYNITDQKDMLVLSEKWRPYRSTACWYLWRSLENK